MGFLIDQVTKACGAHSRVTDDLTIIRGYLDFAYTENPGIAFGQLHNSCLVAGFRRPGVAGPSLAVLTYFLRTHVTTIGFWVLVLYCWRALAAIWSTACAGYVIDFILACALYHWPINKADASICFGALLLCKVFDGNSEYQ